MYGYQGKFLYVDMTERELKEVPLDERDLGDFIGGAGLAAKLIYDRVEKGMDLLGPDNPLVFATGPLTGSKIPMVSRYAVAGISPLTGYWGEATSGGSFPFRLKGSGYDGFFITGRATDPVYLYVSPERVEIRDASHLWGKDIYETQKVLKDEIDEAGMGVACIGPAGEKLIRHSCIMNDAGRAAGRCGLGALMGSKNLKAVVAGGRVKAEFADSDRLSELAKQSSALIKGHQVSMIMGEYGTLSYADMGMALGDVPAKYFTKTVFPVEKVTGHALRQAYAVEKYACLGCPIGCGREVKDVGPDLPSVDGPEYETTMAFGPLCMNTDFEYIIRANHLCNAYGIDTISAGVCVAYAMYLAEQGVLTKERAGLEIKWGDGKTIVRLVEMMIAQEGIGELLSKGTLEMARALGRDEGEAAQVKGLEIPMHDPRAFHGQALSYATGSRGACHLKGEYFNVDIGGEVEELEVTAGDRLTSEGKAESVARFQSYRELYDSMVMCKYAPFTATKICEMLTVVTGKEYTPRDLLTAGDRTVNIKRAINNKLGATREDDKLPEICLRALDEGSTEGVVPDMDLLLREYYEHHKWDWETGKPTKERLLELGLTQAAQDLYP